MISTKDIERNVEAQTGERDFWLLRAARPIFFFIVILTLAGIYIAFQVPISVFP